MTKEPSSQLINEKGALPTTAWIVHGTWHSQIAKALVSGAEILIKKHAPKTTVLIHPVAGVLELPLFLDQGLNKTNQKPGIIVALGCVIKGETAHFDLIVHSVFPELIKVANKHQVALGNGILATDNLEQAMERSMNIDNNKGTEAAHAALHLYQAIQGVK